MIHIPSWHLAFNPSPKRKSVARSPTSHSQHPALASQASPGAVAQWLRVASSGNDDVYPLETHRKMGKPKGKPVGK